MSRTTVGVSSLVGLGVLLYVDLPDRKLLITRQELSMHDWGPERYGW